MTGATRPPNDQTAGRKPAASELEERIERLEERLEESILGDDGLAAIDSGVGRETSGDALKRAVRRSNVKCGSRKA
jgi:hypothetical protein